MCPGLFPRPQPGIPRRTYGSIGTQYPCRGISGTKPAGSLRSPVREGLCCLAPAPYYGFCATCARQQVPDECPSPAVHGRSDTAATPRNEDSCNHSPCGKNQYPDYTGEDSGTVTITGCPSELRPAGTPSPTRTCRRHRRTPRAFHAKGRDESPGRSPCRTKARGDPSRCTVCPPRGTREGQR